MKLKDYFIASELNDYRPVITSTTAMAVFVSLIFILRIALPASIGFAQSSIDPTDVMNKINNERQSRYIPALITNSKLTTAAQGKADDMLARGYFSHIDPDGNYVWPRIEAAGYTPYLTLGENLGMDFTNAADLVAAWMNSPTHRANLLNTQFVDQGLAASSGLYEPNHYTTIVVSLFGQLAKTAAAANTQTPVNPNSSSSQLAIGSDAQVSVTQVSGHSLVDVSVAVSGTPTLVTAKLLTQSITLLSGSSGRFAGTFTFNLSDDLSDKSLTIEARDAAGNRAEKTVTLGEIQSIPDDSGVAAAPAARNSIPVSSQAEFFAILRIIFGALSVIYLGFLVTDWIIIHKNHVQRAGAHLAPQIIIFFIIAFVNLFVKF